MWPFATGPAAAWLSGTLVGCPDTPFATGTHVATAEIVAPTVAMKAQACAALHAARSLRCWRLCQKVRPRIARETLNAVLAADGVFSEHDTVKDAAVFAVIHTHACTAYVPLRLVPCPAPPQPI
eukprot:364511-Chlamydomonas_euryale.AAC.4